MSSRAAVIVPAAGAGRRMGGTYKPMLELAGAPLLLHALRPFLALPAIAQVVIALPDQLVRQPPAWLHTLDDRILIVAGGAERSDSVRAALALIADDIGIVLVHDAARPLVSPQVIARVLEASASGRSAVAAVPVTDTIQQVDDSRRIIATPDRARLWAAQTPQGFPRAVLVDAYARAAAEGTAATDDAALVTRCGVAVEVVEGDVANLKITTPADLEMAAALLRRRG